MHRFPDERHSSAEKPPSKFILINALFFFFYKKKKNVDGEKQARADQSMRTHNTYNKWMKKPTSPPHLGKRASEKMTVIFHYLQQFLPASPVRFQVWIRPRSAHRMYKTMRTTKLVSIQQSSGYNSRNWRKKKVDSHCKSDLAQLEKVDCKKNSNRFRRNMRSRPRGIQWPLVSLQIPQTSCKNNKK